MMLPNDNEEDTDACDFFSLSKQKIHSVHLPEIRGRRCCGSFQNGWLMLLDEDFIFLFNPWSKRRIDLPCHPHHFYHYLFRRIPSILKAAVSDDGKVVVIAFGVGRVFLAFCRIGDCDYTDIDIEPAVEDVIYHKGNFYLFTGDDASLYLLHIEEDGSSPHIEKLTVDLEDDFKIPYRIFGYLVPDVFTDSMFVITRDAERIGEGNDSDEEVLRMGLLKSLLLIDFILLCRLLYGLQPLPIHPPQRFLTSVAMRSCDGVSPVDQQFS